MPVAIMGSAMVSCLGDRDATFAALLAGTCGAAPLRLGDPDRLCVTHGYELADPPAEQPLRASRWLARCVADALADAGVDPERGRVAVLVGTGLRELRSVEQWHADGAPLRRHELHFGAAVRAAVPAVTEVHTLANACAASGYALGLGADLLATGEADVVVAAGCDAITESMLAMVGRMAETPAAAVRPFDVDSDGVLLGEGAVAVVLEPLPLAQAPAGRRPRRVHGVVHGVGLTCDAHHETAPDPRGVVGAMRDAYRRAAVTPADVGLVLAHGTATKLNDPTEAAALDEVFAPGETPPWVTGIKGAVGHTSGSAALMSVLVAVEAMRTGHVPAVVGLRRPIPPAQRLALVTRRPAPARPGLAQVNAFGFGGINAVAVVGPPEQPTPPTPPTPATPATPATPRVRRTGPLGPPAGPPVMVFGQAVHVPGQAGADLPGSPAEPACGPDQAYTVLGRKGLLGKEPSTRLALCAVHRALGLPPGRPARPPAGTGETAVVVASNLGNVETVCSVLDEVRASSARSVSPLAAPNASSNVIASTIAIWYGATGPNLTVCSGATAGLDAVRLASLLLRAGRARRVLVVGVEPADEIATRLAAAGGAAPAPLAAGAACLLLGVPQAWPSPPVATLGPVWRSPGSPDLAGRYPVAAGDFYGAAGVLDLAVAAARFGAAHATGTSEVAGHVTVSCGDGEDGYAGVEVRALPGLVG